MACAVAASVGCGLCIAGGTFAAVLILRARRRTPDRWDDGASYDSGSNVELQDESWADPSPHETWEEAISDSKNPLESLR